jgi:3-dehydroquinate synthetase
MTAPLRTGEPTIVEVALGARAYDIVIGRGLLAELGSRIAALKPGAAAAIVTDETVAARHLGAAEAALGAAGIRATSIIVPPGEASKSWEKLQHVCDRLLDARIERSDVVVALGGGVVGDLAGFAAAILRRGLDVVQVPTTLLAQVDSSVGGKTGINSRHGKNLVGAFHQPILVIADTALLDTLPARDFRAGYAEVAKFGLLGDAGFFTWLEANWQDVFAGGSSSGSFAREHAIAIACRGKAAVVARDERETGDRALLNLGHTFGHAFEAAAGFSGKAPAWRGGCARHRLRVRVLDPPRPAADQRGRTRGGPPCGGRPADPHPRDAGAHRRRRPDDADRAGQEGEARQAHLHSGARYRQEFRGVRCRSGGSPRLPRSETVRLTTIIAPMTSTIVNLLLAIFLLAANAFYVAAEFALVKSRSFRVNTMVEQNRFGARLVQRMMGNVEALSRLLSARHHDGLARPRLGRASRPSRRCSSRRSTPSACRSRRCTSRHS